MDKNVHIQSGNLLMCYDSYANAIETYNQYEVYVLYFYKLKFKSSNEHILLGLAKSHMGMRNFSECYVHLNTL